MAVNLKRIIDFAVNDFSRNKGISIAAIFVLVVTIMLVTGLLFFLGVFSMKFNFLYQFYGMFSKKMLKQSFSPIEKDCACYTCQNYSWAYLNHLFRAKEMLAGTLASIHNLYFVTHLVSGMRKAILDDTFDEYKKAFFKKYKHGKL